MSPPYNEKQVLKDKRQVKVSSRSVAYCDESHYSVLHIDASLFLTYLTGISQNGLSSCGPAVHLFILCAGLVIANKLHP